MAVRPVDFVMWHLRRLVGPTGGAPQTDRQLLEQFSANGNEPAFAALVERHGPMVWGVCSRALGDTPDADDAFQATFLVLLRRAATVPWRESVAGWLHGVAQRIAVKARTAASRRRSITAQVADMIQSDSSTEVDRQELRQVLDEELRRLPIKYREPLVLCYLKGMSHQEAAGELGWPIGSLAKRLAGGRERLRDRLSNRGLVLSAAMLAVLLEEGSAAACPPVPPRLLEPTIKGVLFCSGGTVADTDLVSTQAARLAEGALRTMWFTKLKIAAALTVFLGMLGAGAAALVYRPAADQPVAPVAGSSMAAADPLVAAGPKAPEAEPEPWDLSDDQTLPWGQEVDGLACRMVVGDTTYTTGQPIRLAIQIRNNSKRTRWLSNGFPMPTVIGPDGKEVKRPSGGAMNPRETSSYHWCSLAAGAVIRLDYADLGHDYPVDITEQGCWVRKDGFHAPGKYTLSYSYRSDKMPEKFFEGIRGDGVKVYKDATKEQLAGAWEGKLLANTVSFEVRPLKAGDLTVHEWGVFSVFSEQKYANVNRNAEWGDLPGDFYRQFPERRLVWVPAMNRKPIIYFYSKLPQMHVKATVRFAEGAPVVWWPACTSPADHQHFGIPKDKVIDTLTWECNLSAKLVLPRQQSGYFIGHKVDSLKVRELDLPKASWVADARLPDAALITVHGNDLKRMERTETERFLFYDGLVRAPDHLRCIKVTDDAITLKNTAAFAVGQLFVVDRRPERRDRSWAFGHRVAAIPAGGEVEIPTEVAQGAAALERLHGLVRKALLDAGLFAAEADSLLKIWRKDLLEAGGVTAFYILPQAEYDRMLPLEVQVGDWAVSKPAHGTPFGAVSLPRPVHPPVRVGIAHHPHFEMGPQVRQKVAQLIGQLAADDFATREAATRMPRELGPWAAPQVEEALKLKNSLDTTRRLENVLKNADASAWLRQVGRPEKK